MCVPLRILMDVSSLNHCPPARYLFFTEKLGSLIFIMWQTFRMGTLSVHRVSQKWRITGSRTGGRILRTTQISVWIRRMVIEITRMSVYSPENVRSADMVHRGINLDSGNSTKNKLLYLPVKQIPQPLVLYSAYEFCFIPRMNFVLFHVWILFYSTYEFLLFRDVSVNFSYLFKANSTNGAEAFIV